MLSRLEDLAAEILTSRRNVFIVTTPSGHTGVFKRARKPSLPIIEQTLPSVASTMVQDATERRLRDFAVPVYEGELIRLLNLEMTRAGAR